MESTCLIQAKRLCHDETPSLLEGPADHSRTGGGGSAGQAEGVLEPDTAHLHGEIHLFDRAVELGELHWSAEGYALQKEKK